MSFQSLSTAETNTNWMRGEQIITWADMLHFSIEAQGVLTPFRDTILSYIYRSARGLSAGLLESAIVEVASEPEEEDSLHLHLALTLKMDWEELNKLHDQILVRLAEWSGEWSDDEHEDYGRWVFFSLTPTHI